MSLSAMREAGFQTSDMTTEFHTCAKYFDPSCDVIYPGEAFFIDQGIVVEASDCNITQPGPGGSAPLGKRKSHPTSTGVTVTASRKSVRTSRQPTRLKYDQPGTPTPLN